MVNTVTKGNLRRKEFISVNLAHREETLGQEVKADTGAEAMEKSCLLACSL